MKNQRNFRKSSYEYLPKKQRRKWDPKLLISDGEDRVFFSFRKGSKEIVLGFAKEGHRYQSVWMCESYNGKEVESFITIEDAKQLFGQIYEVVLGPVMDLLPRFNSPKLIHKPKKLKPKSKHRIHTCDCDNQFVATNNTDRRSCFECYEPRSGYDWNYCRKCKTQFQFRLASNRSRCFLCDPE
jgi:hypothetical protein